MRFKRQESRAIQQFIFGGMALIGAGILYLGTVRQIMESQPPTPEPRSQTEADTPSSAAIDLATESEPAQGVADEVVTWPVITDTYEAPVVYETSVVEETSTVVVETPAEPSTAEPSPLPVEEVELPAVETVEE